MPNAPLILDPDAALIKAMASGDSAALAQMMDRHLTSLKSLAWHMLGDDMAAEDVAQEVFLKSWIAARTWVPGRAKFITWMRRVATNLCLDRLRKHKDVLTDSVPDVPDQATGAEKSITQRESTDVVRSALSTLPDRQRAALTLCHYQELSQIEAAGILEISVKAYESLLSRARRTLRAQLETEKSSLLSELGG